MTTWLAHLVEHHRKKTLAVFLVVLVVSLVGISRLTVENRFIDHFKETTEIYRGMALIDRKLGGTTPLDVILDADPEYFAELEALEEFTEEEDEFMEGEEAEAGLSGTSYWYNSERLQTLEQVHRYLEQLSENLNERGRAVVIKAALVVAQSDGEVKDEEIELLSEMGEAMGMTPEQVREAATTTDEDE